MTELWLLFGSSFLAATLLPGGSEALLAYAVHQQSASTGLLLLIATLGNTLGGLTTRGLGWLMKQRFPLQILEKPSHQKAYLRLNRYGSPLLLLSWVPLVGDPLCFAAGWSGIRAVPAIIFMALGKGARYAVIIYLIPVGS
ncbi:MAG: DedA family protein [Gammaproteobacteria bacterium]|nr:DedA family protein [Gammaproteobacteria bacterium]